MKLKDAKYFGIKLSPHRIKNDKGQLIVTGCEFARTGKQKYHSSELGLKDDKFIYLDRPVEEVSDSKTVASFEGAPVTLDHPEDDVKVGVNYDTLAKGFATNVKYIADSDKEGHLQADFIFTDADLIKKIENNEINELSAGYNCDVDEKDWVQRHIRGNHIAVVAQARAGHQARLLDKKYKSTSKSQKTLKIGDKLVNIKDSYSYEIEDENGVRCKYTDYYTETESGKKKFLCTLKDSTDKTVKYAVPESSFKEVEKLVKKCKFSIKNKEEKDGYNQFEVVGDAEAKDCWKDLDAKVKDINSHKNVTVTRDSVNPKNVILVKVNNKWKTYGGSNSKTFEEDSRYDYIINKYGLANTKFVPNENLDEVKLQDSAQTDVFNEIKSKYPGVKFINVDYYKGSPTELETFSFSIIGDLPQGLKRFDHTRKEPFEKFVMYVMKKNGFLRPNATTEERDGLRVDVRGFKKFKVKDSKFNDWTEAPMDYKDLIEYYNKYINSEKLLGYVRKAVKNLSKEYPDLSNYSYSTSRRTVSNKGNQYVYVKIQIKVGYSLLEELTIYSTTEGMLLFASSIDKEPKFKALAMEVNNMIYPEFKTGVRLDDSKFVKDWSVEEDVYSNIIDRELFASLEKLGNGKYVILIDLNPKEWIYADSDEEAKNKFRQWLKNRNTRVKDYQPDAEEEEIWSKRRDIDAKLREAFNEKCFDIQGFTNGNESTEGSIYVIDYNPYKDSGATDYADDHADEEEYDEEEFIDLASEYIEKKMTKILRDTYNMVGEKGPIESIDVAPIDWSGEEEFPINFHIYCGGVTR